MAEPLHNDEDPDENKQEQEEKFDVSAPRPYDIVIYGATGFTGSIAAHEFTQRYATSNINFKWAIAGRNQQKLSTLRTSLVSDFNRQIDDLSKIVPLSNTPNYLHDANTVQLQQTKREYISTLPILIGDVNDDSALSTIIRSASLLICCIGPYRLYGDKVIALCAKYGTHYVDICGEPDFIERSAFKYYNLAQSTGALIVSACGFDSIPSDMGVLFIDQFYTANQSMCSSIDGYLTGSSPDGYQVHDTTLQAAVYGFNDADNLRKLRKQVEEEKGDSYRVSRQQILRVGPKQSVHKELYFWSEHVSKYSMLFPFADSAVVSNSQGLSAALLRRQGIHRKPFPQYAAYISFNSYWNVLQAVSIGGLGSFLVNYEFGRNLLLNYPSAMTFGVFSESGPSEKQRATQTFSFKFFAKGYSKALCKKTGYDVDKLNQLNPDYNLAASVSGKDIAYSGTCKILIECAIVLLQEKERINAGDVDKACPAVKGGVFTPSTVFANTSLIQRLNEAGITFQIEEYPENEKEDEENGDGNEYKEMPLSAPLLDGNGQEEEDDDIPGGFEVIQKPEEDDVNVKVNANPTDDDEDYDYNKFKNLDDDDVPQ